MRSKSTKQVTKPGKCDAAGKQRRIQPHVQPRLESPQNSTDVSIILITYQKNKNPPMLTRSTPRGPLQVINATTHTPSPSPCTAYFSNIPRIPANPHVWRIYSVDFIVMARITATPYSPGSLPGSAISLPPSFATRPNAER